MQHVDKLRQTLSVQGDNPISLETLYAFEQNALLSIVHFRRQYNSHLPPNRLPPEILGEIFESLRTRMAPNTASFTQPLYDYTDILSALTVCHRWYGIATARATLWTFIDFAHDRNAPAKLKRSRMAPLHIRFSLEVYASNVLVDFMRTHGDRLRELHLWAEDRATLSRLLGRLNVLGRNLAQLIVAAVRGSRTVAIRSLFLGSTPTLKALALKRTPWVPSNSFPNLTHLYLSSLTRLSIALLLGLLQHSPMLHLLHIDECDIDVSSFDGETTAAVPLPRLRFLSLGHVSFDPVHDFMHHLNVPGSVMLRLFSLRFWQHADEDEGFGDFLFTNPFTISNDFTRLEMVVGMNWRKLVAESDEPGSGGFWIDFVLHHTPLGLFSEDWEDWLYQLPQVLSLSSIQTLHLCLRVWDVLLHLSHYMPQVRTLAIEEHTPIPDTHPEVSAAHGMIAHLCELLLTDIPISFPNLESISIDASCNLPDPVLLLAGTMKRAQDGRRLRHLRIRVDPSRYTRDYITEQYTEICKHVDEVLFIDGEIWKWEVNEVWRADHDYWELRASEDPMHAMNYWYQVNSASDPDGHDSEDVTS
ncbi:hypothetical protein BV20DRAFT_810005 [Pilatotrama ljubarskyi]|nr:hypothetical protein BV20DRAFT_810005 [Pilatotrama ljubarskyi]